MVDMLDHILKPRVIVFCYSLQLGEEFALEADRSLVP
jgi:hypothetical protein